MIKSKSYLAKLPTELLLVIFQEFDIPTLLNACNVCRHFQQIGIQVLPKKFQEPKFGLVLIFEQGYRQTNITFEFRKFNERSGKFIFKPKSTEPVRFINSSMVRKPVLNMAFFTGISSGSESFILPTPPTSTNVKKLEENFLQKSLSINIKPNKGILKKLHYVNRIGYNETHLKIPFIFKYSIVDTPPSMQKTRDGECWLAPISFECAPSFFYLREATTHKLVMNIMRLREKYLRKKKSSSSSSNHNEVNEQDQSINFGRVDDFISIELI